MKSPAPNLKGEEKYIHTHTETESYKMYGFTFASPLCSIESRKSREYVHR